MQDIRDFIPSYKAIPVICGPTASGKSAIANEICLMTGGELVSCDSMQIYRTLDIGTAKPTDEEQKLIRHHMIDIADPGKDFSVNDFVTMCLSEIKDILERGKLPVLCGGTGQYISSLRDGIRYDDKQVPQELLSAMYDKCASDGPQEMYEELQKVDPEAASKIHPNNHRRVVRALAVYRATGKTMTEWNLQSKSEGPQYPFMLFEPDWEEQRDILYDRINRRVDIMMEQGLADEAARLYSGDAGRKSTCFQAIGYKEFAAWCGMDKDSPDADAVLQKAVYDIKLNSRHYAKRQLTWFRYMDDIVKLPCDFQPSDNARTVLRMITA